MEEPSSLICPITREIYKDPVFIPFSGNTYERSALLMFFKHSQESSALLRFEEIFYEDLSPWGIFRDPLTNCILPSPEMYTNWGKRREVEEFLDKYPTYLPSGWTERDCLPTAKDLMVLDEKQKKSDKISLLFSLKEKFISLKKCTSLVWIFTITFFWIKINNDKIKRDIFSMLKGFHFDNSNSAFLNQRIPFGSDLTVSLWRRGQENLTVIKFPGSVWKMLNFDFNEIGGSLYLAFTQPESGTLPQNHLATQRLYMLPFFAVGGSSLFLLLRTVFSNLISQKIFISRHKVVFVKYISLMYIKIYMSSMECTTRSLSEKNFSVVGHIQSVLFQHGIKKLLLGIKLKSIEKKFALETILKALTKINA
eukprot:snap_masked-scaffold_14-processed-gene-3.53-mRNA-1 protein AED:1.00 eAED:1.00 QI:0/0/0/0/1/1/2/0/365